MLKKVAFIGFGAIGREVYTLLSPLFQQYHTQLAIVRRSVEPVEGDPRAVLLSSVEALSAFQPTLVIEAATQQAVSQYVPVCLRFGATVVLSSIGALADTALLKLLGEQAQQYKGRLVLPSGAIAGLDYLQAVRHAPDLQVLYESRKPIKAWLPELKAANISPGSIKSDYVLFEGNAAEATQRYPQNVNVAATLALAGVGMLATKVRVIVDPHSSENQHSIRIRSQFGRMCLTLENTPSPHNPKSSWVVAHSVAQAVQREFASIRVG